MASLDYSPLRICLNLKNFLPHQADYMFLFDNVDETHNIHNIDCTNVMFPCIRTRLYHEIRRFQLVLP